jgi:uroporphyrinogen decarboxylase
VKNDSAPLPTLLPADAPVFLRACFRQPVEHTPIWLMRQAGRYLPEYRAVRAKADFLTMCHTPELSAEVTLQPVELLGVDAAILFSDLLIPLEAMGATVKFPEGGPEITDAVEQASDVHKLRTPPAIETLGYTAEAVKLIVAGLPAHVPLIGFAGAPFTLASYLIEGGGSKNYQKTKAFLYQHPAEAEILFDKLVTMVADFLNMQIDAGCKAVQIFDSWAGALDPEDYERWGTRYTRRLVQAVRRPGVPVIVFAKGTGTYFDRVAASGADVLGVDWTLPLNVARTHVGPDFALQGNMDPIRLLGPFDQVRATADRILDAAGSTGHIFNLGHGLVPQTPPEHVKRLVDHVHESSAARHRAGG